MTSTPILQSPKCKNSHLFFTCHIPYDPTDVNAKFEVTWTVDGKLLTIPHSPMVLSGGRRDASLDAIHLNRNMGKRVSQLINQNIAFVTSCQSEYIHVFLSYFRKTRRYW